MELRDYQKDCLARIRDAECRGVRRQVVVHPTGAGKTVVFASLIREKLAAGSGLRALVLAHRDELIEQACRKLVTVWPESRGLVGVVKAERDDLGARIAVASVQSLCRPARLAAYAEWGLPLVTVTDEAHHSPARSYLRIYEALSLLPGQDIGGRLHLGVTATPDRLDKVGLKHVFEEVVHALTISFLIESGYLVPVRGVLVPVDIDLDQARVDPETGDFTDASLARVVESPEVIEAIAKAWLERGEGRQTVAFTPSVASARMLAEALRSAGVAAAWVSGETPEEERRRTLQRFADGEITVVVNCGVLTEGYDCPEMSCVLVARPTKSRALYQQMVGRGLRLAPWIGKADCLVLDVAGSSLKHKLVTVASLEGKEPGEPASSSSEEGEERGRGRRLTVYTGAEKVVGMITGFGWHKLREDFFALLAPSVNQALGVKRGRDGDWVAFVKDLSREGSASWEIVAKGPDRGYVFGAAEGRAALVGDPRLLREDARWRGLPPSEQQISFLQILAERRGVRDFEPPRTRGEASDLITKWRLEDVLAPPTEGQAALLRRRGLWEPGLTRKEAARRIARWSAGTAG